MGLGTVDKTRQDNIKAKSLYDKISEKTNWEVYEMQQ